MPNPSPLHDPLANIQSGPAPEPAPAADADEGLQRIEAVRSNFYEEVQQRCFAFARDLLTLIPELESVAVVPAYGKVTEDTPAAILVGREGAPKTVTEVAHLTSQMFRAQQHLLQHQAGFLKFVDQEIAEGVRRLHEQRTLLERNAEVLEKAIALKKEAEKTDAPVKPTATPDAP